MEEQRPVTSRPSDRSRFAWVAVAVFTLLYLIVLVRTAWVCDDAYIVLRTVDNFLHGYGLRWNVAERVQTYTNPLWMFVISSVVFVTREYYYTTVVLGMSVSLAAALTAVRAACAPTMAVLALLCFIGSKSFVDFSTSGLENPLTHLLLGLFFLLYLQRGRVPHSLVWLSLVAALAMVNRMDSALLFLPALGFAFWQVRSRSALWSVALGSLPFVLWELFSLAYYGFLFPNTASAKLQHGIGAGEMLLQGLYYFGNTLRWDPLTLPLIAAGCLIPVITRAWALLPFVAGNLLYLVYVATIGGDFMMGRFFTAPLYVAVLLLSRFSPDSRLRTAAAFVTVGVVASIAPHPSWTTGKQFGVERSHWKDDHYIVDERQIFFRGTGLLRKRKGGSDPAHRWVRQGKKLREISPEIAVAKYGAVGMRGFYAGPQVHLVDPFGLGDPLLARLPAIHNPSWRIAHFQRVIPAGYLPGVRSGENTLVDPLLARYYDKLLVITRGPLFAAERWKAIWGIHIGSYDAWIDRERYRFPPQRVSGELFERESPTP